MAQIRILATAFDSIPNWVEVQEDAAIPVILGVPMRTVDEEGNSISKDGLVWCVFDDPAITEDQALALVEAISG